MNWEKFTCDFLTKKNYMGITCKMDLDQICIREFLLNLVCVHFNKFKSEKIRFQVENWEILVIFWEFWLKNTNVERSFFMS